MFACPFNSYVQDRTSTYIFCLKLGAEGWDNGSLDDSFSPLAINVPWALSSISQCWYRLSCPFVISLLWCGAWRATDVVPAIERPGGSPLVPLSQVLRVPHADQPGRREEEPPSSTMSESWVTVWQCGNVQSSSDFSVHTVLWAGGGGTVTI